MPSYTFDCAQCGATFTLVLPMSQSGNSPSCSSCGAPETQRVFCAPNVVPDAYAAPQLKSCFHALEGDPYGDPPPFTGRSEERRYREAHQSRFGWGAPD